MYITIYHQIWKGFQLLRLQMFFLLLSPLSFPSERPVMYVSHMPQGSIHFSSYISSVIQTRSINFSSSSLVLYSLYLLKSAFETLLVNF